MYKISNLKNSLGYRLAVYILIFSTAFTIISTGLQLVFEYNRDIESINKTADQIKTTHLNSLIQNLWVYDISSIEKELEGIKSLPDVNYVSIISKDRAIFSTGEKLDDRHLSYEYQLSYKHREKNLNLGTLNIEVSLNGVYQRLFNRVYVIFFSQALKTFLVSSFIFVIFHHLIGQHLETMAIYAKSFNFQRLDKPIILQRKKFSSNENDELSLVESAINIMRSNLIKELEAVQLAQDALLESEERFRSLVSNIPGIVYRYKALSPWEIIHISETVEIISGYHIKDFLNGEINFGQLVHPHDRSRISKEVKASIDDGRFFEIEYRIIDKNNNTKWLFEKGKAVYDFNNVPLWIDGVILDVSEKRIAEQQLNEKNHILSAIIENTTDAIFFKDTDRKYILANTATCKAIGREENEVLGKTDYELFPKLSAEVINNIDSSVFDSKKSLIAEERLQTSSGDTYWQTNKTPFLDTEGNLIGMVGISRNITELKLAQNDKEELEKRLAQAQKMEAIGTLAGGIAHDFNNILGAILGYAEIAIESIPPKSPAVNYLNKVMVAGYRAAGLVKQILAFSRQSDVENVVPQQNLWVALGVGRSPSP